MEKQLTGFKPELERAVNEAVNNFFGCIPPVHPTIKDGFETQLRRAFVANAIIGGDNGDES